MRIIKSAFAVLFGGLLLASQASASNFTLMPASGYKFQSGTGLWSDTFAKDTQVSIFDGRSIYVAANSFFGSSPVSRAWVVPIQVDTTSANWSSQTRGFASGSYTQRICSFTLDGAFNSCGASTAHAAISTTFVPSFGTAYVQMFITARNDATINPQGDIRIDTVLVSSP